MDSIEEIKEISLEYMKQVVENGKNPVYIPPENISVTLSMDKTTYKEKVLDLIHKLRDMVYYAGCRLCESRPDMAEDELENYDILYEELQEYIRAL